MLLIEFFYVYNNNDIGRTSTYVNMKWCRFNKSFKGFLFLYIFTDYGLISTWPL